MRNLRLRRRESGAGGAEAAAPEAEGIVDCGGGGIDRALLGGMFEDDAAPSLGREPEGRPAAAANAARTPFSREPPGPTPATRGRR